MNVLGIEGIDLTPNLGVVAKFDKNALIIHPSEGVVGHSWAKFIGDDRELGVWRSLRIAHSYTDLEGNVLNAPDLTKFRAEGMPLYFGMREFYTSGKFLDDLRVARIRPDITVLPVARIGRQFNETAGHVHAQPEIYSVVSGEAMFELSKPRKEGQGIEDIFGVVARAGEHVVFRPGYVHKTINIGSSPLIVTDLVSYDAKPSFDEIRKKCGMPYWVLESQNGMHFEFEKNPRYGGEMPAFRIVKPNPDLDLGNGIFLRRGVPLFDIPKLQGGIRALEFLNSLDEDNPIYDDLYVGREALR